MKSVISFPNLAILLTALLPAVLGTGCKHDSKDEPQNQAPVLSIVEPASNSVNATPESYISFIVSGTDDHGLSKFGFSIQPNSWAAHADSSISGTAFRDTFKLYLPANVPNGTYLITFYLNDDQGMRAESGITVQVTGSSADTSAPTISLTNPLDNDAFAKGGNIQVAGTVTDKNALASVYVALIYTAQKDSVIADKLYNADSLAANPTHFSLNYRIGVPGNAPSGNYKVTVNATNTNRKSAMVSRAVVVN